MLCAHWWCGPRDGCVMQTHQPGVWPVVGNVFSVKSVRVLANWEVNLLHIVKFFSVSAAWNQEFILHDSGINQNEFSNLEIWGLVCCQWLCTVPECRQLANPETCTSFQFQTGCIVSKVWFFLSVAVCLCRHLQAREVVAMFVYAERGIQWVSGPPVPGYHRRLSPLCFIPSAFHSVHFSYSDPLISPGHHRIRAWGGKGGRETAAQKVSQRSLGGPNQSVSKASEVRELASEILCHPAWLHIGSGCHGSCYDYILKQKHEVERGKKDTITEGISKVTWWAKPVSKPREVRELASENLCHPAWLHIGSGCH